VAERRGGQHRTPARDLAPDELAARTREGDPQAVSRALTVVERELPDSHRLLTELGQPAGHVIGLTGSPGGGKSTLTDQLARALRERGERVGVLAVDPSSALTGGALLGDRVRMRSVATDPGVFVRSVAARGSFGGLSATTSGCLRVLAAGGFAPTIVETVGAGQSEVEVMSFAHTVVLVLTPAGGDDVQALKAGIMEIADVFVVNKADLPGAVNTVSYVRGAIDASTRTDGWRPPVLSTRADRGEGIEELLDAIEAHQRHLVDSGGLAQRERRRRRAEVETLVLRRLERGVQRRLDDDLAELDGEGSAVEVAVELMERWAPGLAVT